MKMYARCLSPVFFGLFSISSFAQSTLLTASECHQAVKKVETFFEASRQNAEQFYQNQLISPDKLTLVISQLDSFESTFTMQHCMAQADTAQFQCILTTGGDLLSCRD